MEATGDSIRVRVHSLPHRPGEGPLLRGTPGSAGFDLEAAISEPVNLPVASRVLVPTGVAVAIPSGYEGQIRPRSGLARDTGLTVLNAPATIDSDYRGELLVLLVNLGQQAITVSRGDRIAQLVICPVPLVELDEVAELDPTKRGHGGFGHTGRSIYRD